MFSPNMIAAATQNSNTVPVLSPTSAGLSTGASPASNSIMDSPSTSEGYVHSQRPSTAGSAGPAEPYSRFSPSPTLLRHPQSFQQFPLQAGPDAMIDPLLMEHNHIADTSSIGPYDRTYPSPIEQPYVQSYERYHPMGTNRNGLVEQAAIARFRTDSMRRSGPPSPSDPSAESPGSSIFHDTGTPTSTPINYTNELGDDERGSRRDMAAFNPPSKRMRFDHPGQENGQPRFAMPPPNPSNPAFGYGMNTLAPIPVATHGAMGVPLTPTASSTYSDDSHRNNAAKLSPLVLQDNRDDPRRLSVESLLSGPPGMPYQPSRTSYGLNSETVTYRSHQSTSSGGDSLEEMTTWGMDRGFKDLDEGKNDDANAISGGSPTAIREHLDLVINDEDDFVPTEFGFGIQAKDTAFEKGNYYQRSVHRDFLAIFDKADNSSADP